MRRTVLARPALSSVLSLALAIAPWELASAGPATPKDTAATAAATGAPATDTAPAGTAPADTAPADTAPADTDGTAVADTEGTPADTEPVADTDGAAKDTEGATEGDAKDTEGETEADVPPPEPAPDPMADRPPEPQVAGKPRKGVGLMIAGGTVLGVGLAASITFGLVTRHCQYDGPLKCKYQDQDQFLIPMSVSVTLLGAVLLGVGVGYNLGYKKWQRWTPAVAAAEKAKAEKRANRGRRGKKSKTDTAFAPAMLPGGAGVVVGGRF